MEGHGVRIYTAQLRRYRGDDLLDVTVKSGDSTFSPTWDMVRGIKNRSMGKGEYLEIYTRMMERSKEKERERWLEICNMEEVTVACYCRKGEFCHRYPLVDILVEFAKENGIEAKYMGER